MSENALPETDGTDLRQRAIDLFTFLREVVALRSKIVRSLDSYEQVIWLADIPREPECHCVVWEGLASGEPDRTWLEVRKPHLYPPPELLQDLAPWVNSHELRDSSNEPQIYARIVVAPGEEEEEAEGPANGEPSQESGPVFISLEDKPGIRLQWEKYLCKWRPWAERDRRKQAVQQVYTDLFSLYQQQKELGEAYEVILGLGQLRWSVPSGQEVNRHIIAAQTGLEFHSARGVITVGASADGARPRLEQDMLEPGERPPADIQQRIEDDVASIEDDVWQDEALFASLKSWVNSAAEGRGAYEGELTPFDHAETVPRIRLAPALILRRRTQRGMLDLYDRVLDDLSDRANIPTGLVPLIEVGWEERGVDSDAETHDSEALANEGEADDLYFPLPSNAEQREIVRRLAHQRGVLVQGPPGTGKSHTIANLVSHLLATDRRVLVTSQTPRALRVLRQKIPDEIAALCVVLLGHDRASLEALENSVQGITEQLNTWEPRQEKQAVRCLVSALAELRRQVAQIETELRSTREADTRRHPPMNGGYAGTLQSIGQRLGEEEAPFGWITAFAPAGTKLPEAPGLSNAEALELLQYLQDLDTDREAELHKAAPSGKSVPSTERFEELVRAESIAEESWTAAMKALESGGPLEVTAETTLLRELALTLENILAKTEEIESHVLPFAKQLAADVRAEQDQPWRVLAEQTKARIEAIEAYPEHVSELAVTGCDGIDLPTLREDARALLAHLEAGGRIKRWFRYTSEVRERRHILDQVKVGGKQCRSIEAVRNLTRWADLHFQARRLQGLWSGLMKPPQGDLARQLAAYMDYCEPIESAIELHVAVRHAADQAVKIRGLKPPAWYDADDIRRLKRQVEAVLLQREAEECRSLIERVLAYLTKAMQSLDVHPVVRQLADAIAGRDTEEYRSAHGQLQRLLGDRVRLAARDDLESRLRLTIPRLADALKAKPGQFPWRARLGNLQEAWCWLLTERWLQRQLDPTYFDRLVNNHSDVRDKIGQKIAELAAAKAWGHCMARLTSTEETYLKAWMQAVRRIGAGKGKRATRFRRVAREHLEKCRSAIPAWIMPIHRVVESVTPDENVFDVAIIDEASQSGVEALFLHYIARQVIVVGDDKQIAPDYVGLNRDDVELLRRRYIPAIPLTDHYDLEHSFFDQAGLRYGNRIRLREHFRCMPEIIQFSNNLCYQGEPLIPLRQYGEDRLKPVIATYVSDGYIRGSSRNIVNPSEAERIVEAIEACCRDRRYAGKTFGVISLLGEHQARLIETNLLKKVGPEEIEKRRLVSGDAYTFQGDERDVIFLSLVAAPSEERRFATLTSHSYQRRFNVAASRAKDQMWLFHSVTLDELSPRCLRRRLLEYCLDPSLEQKEAGGTNIAELGQLASSSHRTMQPPSPFESWFEVDVFLQIHSKGYRVLPQYEVAGYRIDLVVTGMKERLAVECDGEEWHGPDRYEVDLARQRQLERCGWRFCRIRGGAFYRSPEEALRPLWDLLERHGIRPEGERVEDAIETEIPASDGGEDDGDVPTSRLLEARRKVEVEEEVDLEPVSPTEGRTPRPTSDPMPQRPFFSEDKAVTACPDPRTVKPREVQEALTGVVRAHGPMPCHFAYHLYARHAGIGRLSKPMRRILSRALMAGVKAGLIKQENEYHTRDQLNQIVRGSGTPRVVMRPRGDRTLYDIPPSEIAEVMWDITRKARVIGCYSQEVIFRKVLEHYDLIRLTEKAKVILAAAYDIYWRAGPAGGQDVRQA